MYCKMIAELLQECIHMSALNAEITQPISPTLPGVRYARKNTFWLDNPNLWQQCLRWSDGWSEGLDHNWGITFIRNSGYLHKMLCARNNNLTYIYRDEENSYKVARSLFMQFLNYSAFPYLGPALPAERGKEVQRTGHFCKGRLGDG